MTAVATNKVQCNLNRPKLKILQVILQDFFCINSMRIYNIKTKKIRHAMNTGRIFLTIII